SGSAGHRLSGVQMKKFTTVFLFLAVAAAAQAPDLILINGKIVTLDDRHPTVEALAARNGVIMAIGATAEIRKLAGPSTKTVDLKGSLAVPGLIEGHGHFTGLGHTRLELDLRSARTWDGIVAQVGAAARKAKPGEWIIGRGW